jgi:hypothetical protein
MHIHMHLMYSMLIRYITVNCVCLGGKWSGVWQISKNFGACGASGKFFSKFRETLIHPNSQAYTGTSLMNSRQPTGSLSNVLSRLAVEGT